MRRYADHGLAGTIIDVPGLFNRMIASLNHLISCRTLSAATQKVWLQPEVVTVVRK